MDNNEKTTGNETENDEMITGRASDTDADNKKIDDKKDIKNGAKEMPKMNKMSKRTFRKMLKGYVIWFLIILILVLSYLMMVYLTEHMDMSMYEEGLLWNNTLWL